MDNTLSIVLNDRDQDPDLLPRCARFIICKRTPFGILEFDATGHFHLVEQKLTLQVKLLGTHRSVQRRASFRIDLRSEVRYRLAADAGGCSDWKTAELHDVSLGGLSIVSHDDTLEIEQELLIEFALRSTVYSASAVVRRIEIRNGSHTRLYALEYIGLNSRQQDSMARAMVQLQISIINSRVKIN